MQVVHDESERSGVRRLVKRNSDWTLKEHEVVIDHWPDVTAIEARLPHRTRAAIMNFAGKCNLRKPLHIWTAAEDRLLKQRVREGVPRKAIAAELGLSVERVANRMGYAKIRYGRRAPSSTGNPLMDAIFTRAFEMNFSRADLDEACGSGGAFRRWSPVRKISKKHVSKAVELLGGRLMPVWEAL